jgi:hypothetical protein
VGRRKGENAVKRAIQMERRKEWNYKKKSKFVDVLTYRQCY